TKIVDPISLASPSLVIRRWSFANPLSLSLVLDHDPRSVANDQRPATNDAPKSPLAGFSGKHPLVELRRLVARYGKRLPGTSFEMLRQKHDLPAVVRVMRDLAIDGLHYGMGFVANENLPIQV